MGILIPHTINTIQAHAKPQLSENKLQDLEMMSLRCLGSLVHTSCKSMSTERYCSSSLFTARGHTAKCEIHPSPTAVKQISFITRWHNCHSTNGPKNPAPPDHTPHMQIMIIMPTVRTTYTTKQDSEVSLKSKQEFVYFMKYGKDKSTDCIKRNHTDSYSHKCHHAPLHNHHHVKYPSL